MSKIRTVKPELFRHEQLFEAEQNSRLPLRLIFIGLFTVVDSKGRFRWRPRQLKLDILPYDEIDFSTPLAALVDYGFIERYEYRGEYYGYIPSWRKHQSINPREPDSVLPDPQQGFIFKPLSARTGTDLLSMHGRKSKPNCARSCEAGFCLCIATRFAHSGFCCFPIAHSRRIRSL